ncbi:MAG: phosphodiester glycosidase family protein [Myxococcales bacterium]
MWRTPWILVLFSSFALASPAFGADSWSNPHPGLALLRRTTSTPWRIFALEVDLCARGVSVRATAESERRRTPSAFRSLIGAQAVVNGDFFSFENYYPIGLAIGRGSQWHADNATMGYVAFGPDHSILSPPTEVLSSRPSWMREAVGGYPILVQNGTALTSFSPAPSHCSSRHPRTAVGLSRDRQKLWLVVVDGRSSSSVGMTCRELATLMAELGAWTALNFDGGGSSAMSIAGLGTVNSPSDGSERTVSNHLAIFAGGTGAPGSCDLWLDEVIVDAAALEATTTTDVDGDGKADICARGASGFRCYPSTGTGFGGAWVLEEMSDSLGWSDETNFATVRMGDVNGDGLADVCARGNARLFCWPSNGSGFGARIDGPEISDAANWDEPGYYSTLRLADFDGDGMDDACARGPDGWQCWRSSGTGFSAAVAGPGWADSVGWNNPQYYGSIRTGDIDGDGKADVCARAAAGIRCALSTGSGFGSTFVGPEWSNDAGYGSVEYWSTIRMTDIDGDGRADLCARGPDGVTCHLSTGSGFGPAVAGPNLTDASGWGDMDNASTIRFGDVDGDGDKDLCARANAGVLCWLWTGSGFTTRIDGPAWDEASGWDDFRHYTTIHLGDMDGDGRADICGRSADGVVCHRATGSGFGPAIAGPQLSDSVGWAGLQYFSTLRFGGPRPPVCRPETETCNGVDDDCDGEVDEGCSGPDAGLAPPDAGLPPADAGLPPADAGINPTDAGDPSLDAGGEPEGDAGTGDAGAAADAGIQEDAGGGLTDGGAGESDAADASELAVIDVGAVGCGCSSVGGPAPWFWLVALGLLLRRSPARPRVSPRGE